jgi:hypothetical protein
MTPEVKVKITADGTGVDREVGKVNKNLDGLKKQSDVLSGSLAKLGGIAAGALSIGAFTGWLRGVNASVERLNDLSDQLGTSVQGLQSLQLAAQMSGGSAEAMATGLSKLQVSLGDALQGGRLTSTAFQQLGLSARELATLPTDQAMQRVAVALTDVENANVRAKLGTDLLGKGFKENAGLFADAGDALSEVNTRLADQGALIDKLDAAKIGIMNDELQFQSAVVTNLGAKFLSGLSPAINVAVDSIGGMISNLGGASEAGEKFGILMVGAVKAIEAGVQGLISWFELWRGVGAKLWGGLTAGAATTLDVLADIADALGLDVANGMRQASDAAAGWSEQFRIGAEAAFASAERARLAAIQAGTEMMNAAEIFRTTNAEIEAAAAESQRRRDEAARNIAGAGAYDPAAARLATGGFTDKQLGSTAVSRDSLGKIDPQLDPEVLRQTSINDTLQAVQEAHNATMLGKIEAFEQTKLGMLLSNADLMQQIEFNKNATLGDAMSSLVGMAIQQGGALGKAGKALAIAQTVWSTGQAIMKAMAEVPWPANIAAAANIAAMGVAQLSNIRRTNVGSGGSIIAGKGGGASSAASPALSDNVGPQGQPLEQQTAVQIIVNGSLFAAQETVDWLAEKLGEAVSSRDMVFISNTSRQAMELRG